MRESTIAKNRVSVLFYYDGDDDYARPIRLLWRGQEYDLAPVKFWHITHRGDRLVHHYTVDTVDSELTFQLALETDDLTWALERCITNLPEAASVAIGRPQLVGAMV